MATIIGQAPAPDDPADGDDETPWTADRDLTRAVLAAIDDRQAVHAECALCGQRSVRLDKFGLCSKKSRPHNDWRDEVRADLKAGAR